MDLFTSLVREELIREFGGSDLIRNSLIWSKVRASFGRESKGNNNEMQRLVTAERGGRQRSGGGSYSNKVDSVPTLLSEGG